MELKIGKDGVHFQAPCIEVVAKAAT